MATNIKLEFEREINVRWPNFTQIYTDVSTINNRCGYAIFDPKNKNEKNKNCR